MTAILISIVILLVISAFFSCAETGLTAISRAKMHRLKNEGNKRAILVTKLRENKEKFISSILLGNNFVNIAASALATSLAISYLKSDEAVFIATAVMTALIVIFSEVMPKTYAIRNAEKVAMFFAPLVSVVVKILWPITSAVQWIVDNTFTILGIVSKSEKQGTEDLRGAIDLFHDEGAVLRHHRDMLDSVLDLAEMEVGEIMVHRNKMETINIAEGDEKIINLVMESSHTRIPVWEGKPDNIIGVLHSKDLVRAFRIGSGQGSVVIKSILKEPWFIPETTKLIDQLNAFRKKHIHFALVVNEYGDLQGLVTLEDIIEEIVGQIEEEHEFDKQMIKPKPDGSYVIDAQVSIRDINRELNWNLPDDEASTLAGLIIHKAQMIPHAKQIFNFDGYRFEILKKNRNQITSMRVSKYEK